MKRKNYMKNKNVTVWNTRFKNPILKNIEEIGASIEVDKRLRTKMLLQIHDELIFECLEKDKMYIQTTIKEAMISISSSEYHMFSVPLEVNVNSGYNWGEVH